VDSNKGINMWIIQWSSDNSPWTNLYSPYENYEEAKISLASHRTIGGLEFRYRLLKCEVLDD